MKEENFQILHSKSTENYVIDCEIFFNNFCWLYQYGNYDFCFITSDFATNILDLAKLHMIPGLSQCLVWFGFMVYQAL